VSLLYITGGVTDGGMAETNENCDNGTVACGKSLTLKWNRIKNPIAVKKGKDTSTDELADFQKGESLENTARSTEWTCRNFKSR